MGKKKSKIIESQVVPIDSIYPDPNNPRYLKKEEFEKLKRSMIKNPDFLKLREIIVDKDGMIKAGNQRYQVAKELGWDEVVIKRAEDFSEEELREFMVRDNTHQGSWDFDILSSEFELEDLDEMGVNHGLTADDLEEDKNPDNSESDHPFAMELDRESNFIVLKFERDIDFLQAKTLLGLKTEKSRRANGKEWSQGIGRVIDGVDAIKRLQNED